MGKCARVYALHTTLNQKGGGGSCTLRKQKRERELQKIVSFRGEVNTFGLLRLTQTSARTPDVRSGYFTYA